VSRKKILLVKIACKIFRKEKIVRINRRFEKAFGKI